MYPKCVLAIVFANAFEITKLRLIINSHLQYKFVLHTMMKT